MGELRHRYGRVSHDAVSGGSSAAKVPGNAEDKRSRADSELVLAMGVTGAARRRLESRQGDGIAIRASQTLPGDEEGIRQDQEETVNGRGH